MWKTVLFVLFYREYTCRKKKEKRWTKLFYRNFPPLNLSSILNCILKKYARNTWTNSPKFKEGYQVKVEILPFLPSSRWKDNLTVNIYKYAQYKQIFRCRWDFTISIVWWLIFLNLVMSWRSFHASIYMTASTFSRDV